MKVMCLTPETLLNCYKIALFSVSLEEFGFLGLNRAGELNPLLRDTSADAAKGNRYIAVSRTLEEELAAKEILSNPRLGGIVPGKGTLNDPR